MIFIIIVGMLLVSFSALFLLEGYVTFTNKPVTILNTVIGSLTTLSGLLLTYITLCFIAFVLYDMTGKGRALLLLLGF